MISIFTLPLAVNETREVAITGEYFELRNALYPITLIELLDRSGGVVCRMDNPEQSDFVRPGRYETVRITNGATAQTVKHFYGTGDAGSRRTSGLVRIDGASDVSVIDGEKNRTIAGGMFAGSAYCAGFAAQYSTVQLWNPLASAKRLVVTSMTYGVSGTNGTIAALMKQAALANNFGVMPANKKADSGAPSAILKYENMAAPEVFALGKLRNEDLLANAPRDWFIKGALIVPAGYGLNVYCASVNVTSLASFEWFEEPV